MNEFVAIVEQPGRLDDTPLRADARSPVDDPVQRAPLAPPRRRARSRGARPNQRLRRRTEERLLDAALEAIGRFGIAKLGMGDVSEFAGVSRGTAYRYFESCDELLAELGRREAQRFEQEVWRLLAYTPEERRLGAALDLASRMAREHPLLQRLPETDPALVLTELRRRYPEIRRIFQALLGPLYARTAAVRAGSLDPDQLVDWTVRLLISTFLFPDDRLSGSADRLVALLGLLSPDPDSSAARAAGPASGARAIPDPTEDA
jgi:AcrR family transcriptional regulator